MLVTFTDACITPSPQQGRNQKKVQGKSSIKEGPFNLRWL